MLKYYREMIVEAFRDNAIKSVLLIDDEYLPYEELTNEFLNTQDALTKISNSIELGGQTQESIDLLESLLGRVNSRAMASDVAKDFVEFFHNRQLICDVENQTDNLDKNKVRKSDLIVLDYHLDKTGSNPAERSLNLIKELSSSKHMNMVVVYTAEPLLQVWLEIAAVLRGTYIGNAQEYFNSTTIYNDWLQNEADWQEEFDEWLSRDIEESYICNEHDINLLLNDFKDACEDKDINEPHLEHLNWLLERNVKQYDKNTTLYSNLNIHGKRKLWIQAGDVFVVLCEKKKAKFENAGEFRDVTPEEVWKQIKIALESWCPSFYRVVTSELQNKIEDANLSTEKVLARDKTEQIAALWGVLRLGKSEQYHAIQELLHNLTSDVLNSVIHHSDFISYVAETANSICAVVPEYTERSENETAHRDYQKAILELAYRNAGFLEPVNSPEMYAVAHAYNETSSTTNHHAKYITTGSILKDENDSWYVCVSPSCNTVPGQLTDRGSRELTPHRQLTFSKLKPEETIEEALQNAHQSNYLFVTEEGGKRRAFSVVNQDSKLPDLMKVVVLNHDNNQLEEGKKAISFSRTRKNKKGELEIKTVNKLVEVISLLRPAYGARYQNIQSHYEGRIGVDFATLDLSD